MIDTQTTATKEMFLTHDNAIATSLLVSVICIVLAVFLVTAISGMADLYIKGQILQAQQEKGNWHIGSKRHQ